MSDKTKIIDRAAAVFDALNYVVMVAVMTMVAAGVVLAIADLILG